MVNLFVNAIIQCNTNLLQQLMQAISFREWQLQQVLYKDAKTTIQLIRHNDRRLVRKTINIGTLGDANAKRELEYMKQIKHPNVVTYIHHEYMEPKKDILKVYMPYYPNSDLHHFISHHNPSFDERMRMFIDILVGLQQLHSRFIIHRDIKLKNIFVAEDRSCVIGDLGISTTSLDSANSQVGTYCYNAPQIYSEDGWYSEKVDFWAIGIIAYQLFNAREGRIPFPFIEPSEMLSKISPYRHKIDYASYIKATDQVQSCIQQLPPQIQAMIVQMLQNDPKKRISWAQFYEEGILNKYDLQNRLCTFRADYKLMETTKSEYKRGLERMKRFKQAYFLKLRHILREDNQPFFKKKYPILQQEIQAIYRIFLMMLKDHAQYFKQIREKRIYKYAKMLKPLYKAIARQIDLLEPPLNKKDKKIKSGIDFDSNQYFNDKFRIVTELLDQIDAADFKNMERIYQ